MGLLDSLKMLGTSNFSSREEKSVWTIQFLQIATEHPDWSRDDVIKLMQTEEATKQRKEFVRNHSPTEIETIVRKLLTTIESANQGVNVDNDDLTQSEYDYLMKELETDRKYWTKEEANAMTDVLSKIDTLEKSLEQEEVENKKDQEDTHKWTWKTTIINAIIFTIVVMILRLLLK